MKTLKSVSSPLAASFRDSVGVNIHVGVYGSPYVVHFDTVLSSLKDLGITHVRNDAFYIVGVNETFGQSFYQRIRALGAAGIRICMPLHDPLNGYLYAPPSELEKIYRWCNGAVELFEGGNEPYIAFNPDIRPWISYEHQKSVFNTVKGSALLKDIPVLAPSYIQDNWQYVLPSSDVADYVNLHTYPGSEHPETKGPGSLMGFATTAKGPIGDKPMIVTENGYHTLVSAPGFFFGVTEAIKVRYLNRMLLFAFINGMQRTYIYELVDALADADGTNLEAHFGLLDVNLVAKPSYSSLKNLMDLFKAPPDTLTGSPDFTLTVGDCANVQTALFKREDGKILLAAWLGVSGWDQVAKAAIAPVTQSVAVTISPAPTAMAAHLFNDDGTVTSTSLTACGSFNLTVSDQLTVLEIA